MLTPSNEAQRTSERALPSDGHSPDVTLFVPDLTGGGAERVVVNLASALNEQGFVVDLLLLNATGPYLEHVPDGVRVVVLHAERTSQSLFALRRYIHASRSPIVISSLHHANLAALTAKKVFRLSTRVIPTIHNTLSIEQRNPRSIRHRIQYAMISRCYRWADGIVAVSNAVADDFVATTGIPRDSLKCIYNPVVTPELFSDAAKPIHHPWFANDAPPVILGIGRLGVQKDFPTLIRAFARVRQHRRVRLVILGEGEDRSMLEGLVRTSELRGSVELPGFVDNPYPFLRRANVFALSSRWEGLPTVLIEALALGTPLVATDCPSGPREILEEGRYGELVPVGDVDELAAALDRALDRPRTSRHRTAWERYTPEAAAQAYVDYAGINTCDSHG